MSGGKGPKNKLLITTKMSKKDKRPIYEDPNKRRGSILDLTKLFGGGGQQKKQ